MSKYIPFNEQQMKILRTWFRSHDKAKRGVLNAYENIPLFMGSKHFKSGSFMLIEKQLFDSEELEEVNEQVTFVWNAHLEEKDIDFPEFVRLVALFTRQLDPNDTPKSPSLHGPNVEVVKDPSKLGEYLSSHSNARLDYIPPRNELERCVVGVKYPPTGDLRDQPCCMCCLVGLVYAIVMDLVCCPCGVLVACNANAMYSRETSIPQAVLPWPWSLLHWAVLFGMNDSIKLLIEHGAPIDVATDASQAYPCRATPYDLAMYLKRADPSKFNISEENMRLLEPIEMRMARVMLQKLNGKPHVDGDTTSNAKKTHKLPNAIQGFKQATAADVGTVALGLAPYLEDDMLRDEPGLEGPNDTSLQTAVEHAIDATTSGVTLAVGDAKAEEEEEAEEVEVEEDDDDDVFVGGNVQTMVKRQVKQSVMSMVITIVQNLL